jgi:hypothetical protein
MSIIDDLKKEAEQVARDSELEPTAQDIVEASAEVKAEQEQAIQKPIVIQSVEDKQKPSTTKLTMKKSDMDILKRQMMSKEIPGYGMTFGTDKENLPAMSRLNRVECAAFATVETQAAVICKRLAPDETVVDHWMNAYMLRLQGVDGKAREEYIMMDKFRQEETNTQGGMKG